MLYNTPIIMKDMKKKETAIHELTWENLSLFTDLIFSGIKIQIKLVTMERCFP